MKYILNEYHQGVTDDELLNDVKSVADKNGDKYLSIREYEKVGKYTESTIRSHFGSWIKVLEKLNLRTEMNSAEMQRITDKMMIDDLIRVSTYLGKKLITSSEYDDFGKYAFPTIKIRFGSWAEFANKAGLEPTGFIKKVEYNELFNEIERIWVLLGRQPTTTDMKKGISKYSLETFSRRFGGWRKALTTFINFINSDDIDENESNILGQNENTMNTSIVNVEDKNEVSMKRTSRNINLKIRFRVLQRDNFKCCFCGASPAKDPNVELHIDHIIPWSKNGETVIENLQTLCSKCNLGKSDIEL